MDKAKEVHGLMKIPDSVLISELRIEIGKQAAYIQELEDRIRFLTSEETDEKRAIRREKVFDEYRGRIRELEKRVQRLRSDNEYLITKLSTGYDRKV